MLTVPWVAAIGCECHTSLILVRKSLLCDGAVLSNAEEGLDVLSWILTNTTVLDVRLRSASKGGTGGGVSRTPVYPGHPDHRAIKVEENGWQDGPPEL